MNSSRLPVLDRLRVVLTNAWREINEWASPVFNPFVVQSRAQEAHRPTLWRALMAIIVLWLALMLVHWSVTSGDERDVAGDAALGWIGVTLVVALVARSARCVGLLRVEVLKNRFEPLQLLPLESARRAWLWCAPVSQFAFLLCALALPALAWELGSHRLALHDALGLGFIALVCGWGAPLWRPHVWRAQISKAGASNASLSDGFVVPPPPDAPAAIHLWSSGAFLVLAALLGAGAATDAPAIYWQSLPAHLRATGAQWWLSWPLFGARWLTEAQPFFGWSLAPLWLLGPVWVASVHNTILRLGAVTAREPYWTPPRALNWWRAGRIQSWGLMAFCGGVLWAGAIEGAWLSGWFFGAARATDWALSTAWILALFVGALSAASRWKTTLELPTENAPLQRRIPIALRAAARSFAWVFIGFGVACALGGNWPFGAVWLQILPASLAIAATWLGAALVTSAGTRIPHLARAFGWFNGVWFYGGPLLYVALHYIEFDLRPFTPQIYFLSPWTLWWTLRQPKIASFALFWPAIAAHMALIAASSVVLWRARATVIGQSEIEKSSSAEAATPPFNDLWKEDATATQSAPDQTDEDDFDDENDDEAPAPVAVLGRAPLPAPDAWLRRVLEWLTRFDNPLLLLETRRVIGNGLQATFELARILNIAVALLLLVILPAWGLYTGAFPTEFAAVALAIALLVWGAVSLNGIEGTSRCYDHDRVDGSLQMLFLTPLTEREIAVGKIGPFVSRAALLLAFYAPLWLMGLLPALFFHEPIIVVAYLLAPLFVTSFALRIATISHWTALKKRKIGTVSVPLVIVVGAIVAVPDEFGALVVGASAGAWGLALALLGLSFSFVAEAALFWWLSLRQLRHRRFLDAPVGR